MLRLWRLPWGLPALAILDGVLIWKGLWWAALIASLGTLIRLGAILYAITRERF